MRKNVVKMNVVGLAIFLGTAAMAYAGSRCNIRGDLAGEVKLFNVFYSGNVRNGGDLIFPPGGALLTMAEAQKNDGSCFIKVAAKIDQNLPNNHITGVLVVFGDKDCKSIVEADIIDTSPFISVKINGDSVTFPNRYKAYDGNCANRIKIFKYGNAAKPTFVVRDMNCSTKVILNSRQNGLSINNIEDGLNGRGPCGSNSVP